MALEILMQALLVYLKDLWQRLLSLWDGPGDWWQWGLMGGALVIAFVVNRLLQGTLFSQGSKCRGVCERFFSPTRRIGGFWVSAAAVMWVTYFCADPALDREPLEGAPYLRTAALLFTAFAFYRLALSLSKGRWAPRLIGGLAFGAVVLHLLGQLDSFVASLQSVEIPLGDLSINLWAVLAGFVALFVLIWLAGLATRFLEVGMKTQSDIPPSMRVLIGKISRFVFYLAAILVALKIGGVNLGALTVFSGALGLGVGFGLQKVISNLVSGVIILLDKSIKPGDVIEIDDAYGTINSLRTRYVSVLTRDRKEYLIPNEDFITSPVINWSFSAKEIRIRANVGIGYGSDVRKAVELCVEAASAEERVLKNPAPNCLLMGFGDSAIDLQIRFWIRDADQGVANIRSKVLLGVWDRFQEHGVEIPFPQRDVHIKSGGEAG